MAWLLFISMSNVSSRWGVGMPLTPTISRLVVPLSRVVVPPHLTPTCRLHIKCKVPPNLKG